MKTVLILGLVMVAAARPADDSQTFDVRSDLREDQSYDFGFRTSNDIQREESGASYPGAEPETGNYVVTGSYQFQHPDGTITHIKYIADQNGYRAIGDVIPVFDGSVSIQEV